MSQPSLIQPSRHIDERGILSHFRNTVLDSVRRIYFITSSPEAGFRGWHGHKYESKTFFVIDGIVKVSCVRVVSWDAEPTGEDQESFVLEKSRNELLVVPEGFANGIEACSESATVMVLSNRSLADSQRDDYRFPPESFWPST